MTSTRVIAVWIPNTNDAGSEKWSSYRVSVDEIEKKTGLNLFSSLPTAIQDAIERKTDTAPIQLWAVQPLP